MGCEPLCTTAMTLVHEHLKGLVNARLVRGHLGFGYGLNENGLRVCQVTLYLTSMPHPFHASSLKPPARFPHSLHKAVQWFDVPFTLDV